MADIRISQAHSLPHKKARAAAQRVADKMAEEYDMEAQWDGDVLRFKRSGVIGTLALHQKEARLEMTLGVLLSVFAPMIEAHVAENLKKAFHDKS